MGSSMGRPQRFFDWTGTDFPPEVYQGRRQALRALLEERDAVMLIPSRHGPDVGTFRQNDNFLYFTGLELPDSVLLVDARGEECLFLPRRDSRFDSPARTNDFPGRPLYDDPDFRERCGFAVLEPFEAFGGALRRLEGRTVCLPLPGPQPIEQLRTGYIYRWDNEQGFAAYLRDNTGLKLENGYPLIARLRMVKGPEEVEAIRAAVKITEQSILETLPLVGPGVDERTLIGKLEYEFRRRGSQRVAFDSILKTGPNAHCPWRILGSHYNRRNQVLEEGDVLVFDVGAELNYYTSDIGRTFPVGEAFTPLQYDSLERVRHMIEAVKEAIRPGVLLGDLREVALGALDPAHHVHVQVDSYYGHHIGLSAGDPSLLEAPLEPGMVFTIEPWYYNHRDGVSVFTEENIVVTETGLETLSDGISIHPRDLEALRRQALE